MDMKTKNTKLAYQYKINENEWMTIFYIDDNEVKPWHSKNKRIERVVVK